MQVRGVLTSLWFLVVLLAGQPSKTIRKFR